MFHTVFLLLAIVACLSYAQQLESNVTTGYSGSTAASWALSCIPGCSECPECTSSTCSCGCTYFTTRKNLNFTKFVI